MSGITKKLSKNAEKEKDFLIKILSIENNFIKELKNKRSAFIKQYRLRNFSAKHLKIVEDLYEKGNSFGLKGK